MRGSKETVADHVVKLQNQTRRLFVSPMSRFLINSLLGSVVRSVGALPPSLLLHWAVFGLEPVTLTLPFDTLRFIKTN